MKHSNTSLRIELQRRVRSWAPLAREIATWAGTALGPRGARGELGVRVVGAAESRRLNARYRGKDRPTNVLSFPPPPLPARGSATITSRREGADYSARPGLRPSGAAKRGSARRSTKAQGALLNADRRARRAEAQDAPSKSLPTIWSRPLGDLVICAQVVRSEARLQRKPLQAHWAHLIVHGALHLVGYDHERESDAKRMERREIAVLRRLGFANPYRV